MFATEALREGTIVARLRSRIVDDATLGELFADGAAEDGYVDTIMIDDDQNLVLAADQLIHFCNHSCDPSLWHLDTETIASRRAVSAGEELTIDCATQTSRATSRWTATAVRPCVGAPSPVSTGWIPTGNVATATTSFPPCTERSNAGARPDGKGWSRRAPARRLDR